MLIILLNKGFIVCDTEYDICEQIATNPSAEAKHQLVIVSKHVASAVAELVQTIDAIRGDISVFHLMK